MVNRIVEYQGKPIEFRNEYMHATALCKANGKDFAHWRENDSTKEFLAKLSAKIGIPILRPAGTSQPALIIVQHGGRAPGTFVHRFVWYHLAQWCSADCAVWVSTEVLPLFHEEVLRAAFGEPVALDQQGLFENALTSEMVEDLIATPPVIDHLQQFRLAIEQQLADQQTDRERDGAQFRHLVDHHEAIEHCLATIVTCMNQYLNVRVDPRQVHL